MFLTVPAYGHHSVSTHYDASKIIEISGVVKAWIFRSPHTFLQLEVKQEDGSIKEYRIEGPSVPSMGRLGYNKNSFKPGDLVSVTIYPNRDPSNSLVFGKSINGQTIIDTKEVETVVDVKEGLSGVMKLEGRWQGEGFKQNPVRMFRKDGTTPLPLTAAGYTAWKNYDQQNSPAATCEPANVPATFEAPDYLYDIRIKDDEAILTHEAYAVTRVVPLASEPRKAESTGLFGKVKGRIEGEALIVESTDFPPSKWGIAMASLPLGNGGDVPSSVEKKLVERYTTIDDGKTLRVDFTIEDPVFLTEKYASYRLFKRVPDDTPLLSDKCDIESAARYFRSGIQQ
jgi:hypothetical protein